MTAAGLAAAFTSLFAWAGDDASQGPSRFEILPKPEGAVARFGGAVTGHTGAAMAVAVTRDFVVSAGSEGLVHFWDRRSRAHRSVLWVGEPGGHALVRLSDDAKRLAYVSRDKVYAGGHIAALMALVPFERPWYPSHISEFPETTPTSLAIDREGRFAYWIAGGDLGQASAPLTSSTAAWYGTKSTCTTRADLVAAGRERVALADGALVTIKEPSKYDDGMSFDPLGSETLTALWLSPDSRMLAAGGSRGHVGLWKLVDRAVAAKSKSPGTPVFAPVACGTETVRSVALSEDGATLTVAQPASICVLDAKTGAQRLNVAVSGELLACALSEDRRTLVAGRADGSVSVWDVAAGFAQVSSESVLSARPVALNTVESVSFVAGGGIACAADDGSVRVGKADGTPVETILAAPDGARALAIAPDGSAVLRSDGKSLRLEARPGGEVRWTIALAAGAPAALSEDATQVAVTEDGKRLVVLDAADGRVIARTPGDGAWWGSQGTFPARGAGAPLAHVDRSGRTNVVVPARAEFGAAACSRDGRLAVVVDRDHGLVTFRDGLIVRMLDTDDVSWEGRTSALAVSDDGARVAAASTGGNLTIYDTATGAAVARFVDPAYAPVTRVVFFAGGRVATCDAYGTAIVWDLKRAPR